MEIDEMRSAVLLLLLAVTGILSAQVADMPASNTSIPSSYPRFFGASSTVIQDSHINKTLDLIASRYSPPKPPNSTIPTNTSVADIQTCLPSLFRQLLPVKNSSKINIGDLSVMKHIAALKSSVVGGSVVKGGNVISGYFGCGSLPVMVNHEYLWYRPLHGALSSLEHMLAPVLKHLQFGNYSSLQGGVIGGCALINCDSFAVSFLPAFIPLTPPGALSIARATIVFIAGFGLSSNNSLAHNVSAVTVWDGLSTDKFLPRGSYWLQIVMFAKALLTAPSVISQVVHVAPHLSIFGGVSTKDGSHNLFVTVESFQITLLYVIPVLNLGSGNGGIRTISRNDTHGDICTPSGIFVRVAPDLTSPLLDPIVSGYLGRQWFVAQGDVDLAIKFTRSANNTSSGFNFNHFHALTDHRIRSLQLRANANLIVLGIPLFHVLVEFQYMNPEEIQKRKFRRMKSYGCSCQEGFDERGICKDEVAPAEQWIQNTTMNHHVLTISAKASAHLPFGLVDINNATFIFAVPLDPSGRKEQETPLLLVGGTISVLCLRNIGAYVKITHPSSTLNITGKVSGLVEVTIQGRGDTSHLNVDYSWDTLFATRIKTESRSADDVLLSNQEKIQRLTTRSLHSPHLFKGNKNRTSFSDRLKNVTRRIHQFIFNEDENGKALPRLKDAIMNPTTRTISAQGTGMLGKWSFIISIRWNRFITKVWNSILQKVKKAFGPVWKVITGVKHKIQNLIHSMKRDLDDAKFSEQLNAVLQSGEDGHPSQNHMRLFKRALSNMNKSSLPRVHALESHVDEYHSHLANLPKSILPLLVHLRQLRNNSSMSDLPPPLILPARVDVPLPISHNSNIVQKMGVPWSCPKGYTPQSSSDPNHAFLLEHTFHFGSPESFSESITGFRSRLESTIWNRCYSKS